MAELAFLSEKSRNDTRASNNLQKFRNNLRGLSSDWEHFQQGDLQTARKESASRWDKPTGALPRPP